MPDGGAAPGGDDVGRSEGEGEGEAVPDGGAAPGGDDVGRGEVCNAYDDDADGWTDEDGACSEERRCEPVQPVFACPQPPPLPACERLAPACGCAGAVVSLPAGIVEIDIRSHRVAGELTLNGGRFPDAAGPRGRLALRDERGEDLLADAGDAGPIEFSAQVLEGRYELWFYGGRGAEPQLVNVLLDGDLHVDRDLILHPDVRLRRVAGRLTMEGGPAVRSNITFTELCSRVATVVEVVSGELSILLPVGTYQVRWTPLQGPVLEELQLEPALEVAGDRVVAWEVHAAPLAGRLQGAGGGPLRPGLHGRLKLAAADDLFSPGLDLGTIDGGGRPELSVQVPLGRYDLRFEARQGSEVAGRATIAAGIEVAGPTLLDDLVLEAHRVAGSVTWAGADLPDGLGGRARGTLVLRSACGPSWEVVLADLGHRGPIEFSTLVFPGMYDLVLMPGTGLDLGSETVLQRWLSVSGPAVLDVDLPVVRVAGSFFWGGESAGYLLLVRRGTTGGISLGSSSVGGLWEFSHDVLAGVYDVRLDAALREGDAFGGTLLIGREIFFDTVLDLELRPVRVAGQVRWQGGALPDGAEPRGQLALEGVSPAGTIILGNAGEAEYSFELLPDRYTAVLHPGPGLPVAAGGAVTCFEVE
ncbi:MAG: hypothetical protein FJ125_11800 [Deltaproteobacteria bacterium]|nr:hypothetical protein [Deltaproteobacteria bacterium]